MSDSDETFSLTPLEVLKAAEETSINLLPEKSRKKYEKVYNEFLNWRCAKNTSSFSENVLLAYFSELSNKFKCSSLWSIYSMLRSTINLHNGVKIEKYLKLRMFLKRKAEGHTAKKSKTFSSEQINTFINDAPDEIYLAIKVI